MTRYIGVIGYHNVGKTSLIEGMVSVYKSQGLNVAVVKHTKYRELDVEGKDTWRLSRISDLTVGVAENQILIVEKGRFRLEDLKSILKPYDIVVVEGFKQNHSFPKIVVVESEEDYVKLKTGLEILAVSQRKLDLDIPVYHPRNDLETICKIAYEKAFKLPNLNCRECGYTCSEMAALILNGEKSVQDCKVLSRQSVKIMVDDSQIDVNRFVADLIGTTVKAMISRLRGYRPGAKITIEVQV